MGIRFSLITPIRNIERYLPQCIESMVGQSYQNIEIILVDDGSTDGSPAICDEYAKKDERVAVIHKENGGIVSARQAGVEIARGEYVLCVDGDDWIDPDYCERMSEMIDKHHPDIVCCGYVEEGIDAKSVIGLEAFSGHKTKEDIRETIFPILLASDGQRAFPLSLWAKAVKTELIRKYQLHDVVVNIGEDVACMAPCIFHAESMYVMEEHPYHYRQTPDSMTKGKRTYRWDGPEIRGRHIEENMDLSIADLREQHYRSLVISLYTVVRSQFHRAESTKSILRDVRRQLKNPYYVNAIKQCRFYENKSGKMKRFLLKYKLYYLIKVIG